MTLAPATAPDVHGDPAETPGSARSRRRRPRAERIRAVLAVVVGTGAIGAHAALYGNWLIDDAGITFAYARSVSEGLGVVLRPGAEPVEGFSNPLWLLVLTVGRLLGLFDSGAVAGAGDYVLFPKTVALVCCAGILAVCHSVTRRVVRHAWVATLAVGLALASVPSFVIWSFSGLENPLYALIVVCLAAVLARAALDGRVLTARVAVAAGVLAAAAALTRPDGLIYAGAYPFVVVAWLWQGVRRGRGSETPTAAATGWRAFAPALRRVVLSTTVFVLPVGAYLAWRRATFGRWVPNTSVAKNQQPPTLSDLTRAGELVAYAGAPLVLLSAVVLALVLARRMWWRAGLVALLVPLGLAVAAYSVLNADWMSQYRFATPVWVLGALVAVLSTAELLRRSRAGHRTWLAGGLALALTGSGAAFADSAGDFRASGDVTLCNVADRSGRVFNAYADILGLERGSLLNPDLGGAALTSRLELVDMAGLAEPRIADLLAAGDRAGLRDYVFEQVRPTFIHSRAPWSAANGIPADPRMERDYHRIYEHPRPGPSNGDWVRRDVVPDAASLAALREYAHTTVAPVDRANKSGEWPRRRCGDTLRPGQTAVGRT